MKTNSLQKGNRPREKYGTYVALAAAVFVLIAGFLVSGTIENAVHFALAPFWSGGMAVEGKVSDFFSVFYYKQKILEDNKRLQGEIETLQLKLADDESVKSENATLSAELGKKPKEASFAASVVLRPPELPYDTFMLDLGADDGIAAGDIVLGPDGTYLGSISAAYSGTSKAELASTPGLQTKAILGSEPVSFAGMGGGNYEGRIPQLVNISEGEAVPVSGTGFVFGRVAKIETDANNAYRRVIVSSGENISEIGYVFIVKSK